MCRSPPAHGVCLLPIAASGPRILRSAASSPHSNLEVADARRTNDWKFFWMRCSQPSAGPRRSHRSRRSEIDSFAPPGVARKLLRSERPERAARARATGPNRSPRKHAAGLTLERRKSDPRKPARSLGSVRGRAEQTCRQLVQNRIERPAAGASPKPTPTGLPPRLLVHDLQG